MLGRDKLVHINIIKNKSHNELPFGEKKFPVKNFNIKVFTYIITSVVIFMPRNQLSRDELKVKVLNLKHQLQFEHRYPGEKELANKYLNEVLFIIEQYSR